ncbi:MAG: leucine-rich repeat protein [Bacteroidales bacterium]|nr:leucine-rich repeat protein [Bacteroidales bacterium]
MKKSLLILLAIVFAFNLNSKAESFSAVNNGDTIYYNIISSISPRTVEVTYKGSLWNSFLNEYSGVVSIPDSVLYSGNYYKVTSIGGYAFCNCSGLTSISIPSSVTSIGNSAFINNTSLDTVYFNTINCSYMGNFTYPVFQGCNNLSEVIIGNSVQNIPNFAFQNCTELTSITIPNSVTSIGDAAFYHCTGLISITISNSVTSIGHCTFQGCTGLTSITIPASVISIGESTFCNNFSLDTVFFNAVNCITMGSEQFPDFQGLNNLSVVIIGDSVQNIPNYAFKDCTGLTSITSNNINPPSISENTFYGVNKTIPLYVVCNSIPSYNSALYWSEFTNEIGVRTPQFITSSICEGEYYTDYGANLDSAGVYTLVSGCDSVILNLSITPSPIIPTALSVQVIANYIEFTWQGNGTSYAIYRNDSLIANVTQPIYLDYDVVNGQSYCYKVQAISGDCESEFSNVVCKSFSGLNDISSSNIQTKLYPNPTDNKSKLEVDGLKSEADVIVSDLLGRVIKSYKINPTNNELEIDVNGFVKGVYSIRIINEEISISRKLIVN